MLDRMHVTWLFPVTDMDFPLLDMRAVAMRYVESHIYCYIVPVILFMLYCSHSRYIVLCYQQSSGPVIMLPVSGTVFIPCILDISDHKFNWGMGETWRLIRSYRVMYWIHIVLPLQGMVALPTNCSMSYCYLIIVPLLAEGSGLSSQGFDKGRDPGYARDTLTR